MKLITRHNNLRFEIVEDSPEVGFCLYVFDGNNSCILDYIQDSEKTAKGFSQEEFGVAIDSWTIVD